MEDVGFRVVRDRTVMRAQMQWSEMETSVFTACVPAPASPEVGMGDSYPDELHGLGKRVYLCLMSRLRSGWVARLKNKGVSGLRQPRQAPCAWCSPGGVQWFLEGP